jgi:hypothetical protein
MPERDDIIGHPPGQRPRMSAANERWMRRALKLLEKIDRRDAYAAQAVERAKEAAELAALSHKRNLPRCEARCRSRGGAPCVARVVVRWFAREDGDVSFTVSSRCRMHGGLSTGPRTEAGRQRCVEAGRKGATERWRRWREQRELAPC